jgi:hypothetical protein
MAQINGQVRQPALHLSALSVPGDETVDGKGMTIMPISALSSECRLPDYAESGEATLPPSPFGATFRTFLTN